MIIDPLYFLENISVPLEFIINDVNDVGGQDIFIRPRTEKGWSLDFVFNRNSLGWDHGNVFYYWGIKDEDDPQYYLDNNLSFSFSNNGEIIWKSFRYKGNVETLSGYTGYISSGKTYYICELENDFNVTITFERNKEYSGCELENEGGINDLIVETEVTNTTGVITGDTENVEITYELNSKWYNERTKRLGTLKVYLNGNPLYKLTNWEEIIPFERGSLNDVVQIIGSGTTGSGDIHTGTTEFNIKEVSYFEYPLTFMEVRNHYLNDIYPLYDISICDEECVDTISGISP